MPAMHVILRWVEYRSLRILLKSARKQRLLGHGHGHYAITFIGIRHGSCDPIFVSYQSGMKTYPAMRIINLARSSNKVILSGYGSPDSDMIAAV